LSTPFLKKVANNFILRYNLSWLIDFLNENQLFETEGEVEKW